MQILSHRGYWNGEYPKNSLRAFERSFEHQFGTETDFRDSNQALVISHDLPVSDALLAANFFSALASRDKSLPIAINIKSDGLQTLIKKALVEFEVENYFLFDMSVPDALASIKAGLNVFTRHSDIELEPCFYKEATGVWMDALLSDTWLTPEAIATHLNAGKQVCIVSPELHGRLHLPFWERLKNNSVSLDPTLMLCSDFPEDARTYFQS